jgi:type IV secretion system protein VirD4
LVAVLIAFDWLGGALVFLAYHESPLDTRWTTLPEAWRASAAGGAPRQRVHGAMLLAGLGVVGMVAAVLQLVQSLGKPRSLYGDARFASYREIKKAGLFAESGIILGRFQGRLLRLPGPDFVLLAAPTRSGKGVSFVIPNLLDWRESVVVLDIKGENYALTSEFRHRKLGSEIYIFNPFSENSHACNFLSYVSEDPHFRVNDLQALAAIVYPTDRKNPFWTEQARNLFVGLGLLVLETPELPHTIGEMLRQVSGKGQATDSYLKAIIDFRSEGDAPLSGPCTDALNRFLQSPEETLRNVIASFTAPLALFANPVIDKATSRDDFDLRGLRKRRMSVYVTIPTSELTQAGFILNLFFSTLISQNVRELPEQNPELKYTCLLMMDEFTAVGRIAAIAKGVGFMAGYGLRLAIVIQDRAQLEEEDGYGRAGTQNLLANMGATIFFTPRTEAEAESYSKMIGFETMKVRQRQRSNIGLGTRGNASLSETELLQRRAVMLPQELRALENQSELVQRPGLQCIRAQKISYLHDREFVTALRGLGGTSHRPPQAGWATYQLELPRSDYYLSLGKSWD